MIVFVSLFAIWLLFYFIPVGLWFSALVSGVRISLLQLVLMRWRKVPPSTIVSSMIESTKAGLTLNPNELEAHYLAGGNVTNVVHALVSAQKANIMLDFKMATAIDLAGRDVFEAVQMSVNPKVINTPPVAAVAKDGIQLIAKARVTVRANIKQLVGGAGEETVLARVGGGSALDLERATRLIAAVERKALSEGKQAVIAVANAQGNPVAVHVMDGAFLVSYEVAVRKAYTAVAVKMPTAELARLVQPGGTFYGLQNLDRIVTFGGGVPLYENGVLIGGLGVSGGTGEEDHALAVWGAANLAHT